MLSLQEILAAPGPKPFRVETPEWHHDYQCISERLRSLTEARASIALESGDKPDESQAAALASCDAEIAECRRSLREAHVWFLPMNGTDLDSWDQKQSEAKWPHDDKGNRIEGDWRGLRAFVVGRQMCGEDGVRFGPSDADLLALSHKSGAALNRCFRAIEELSGLLADAVEDAEKNSPPGQTGSSG